MFRSSKLEPKGVISWDYTHIEHAKHSCGAQHVILHCIDSQQRAVC